VADSIAVDDHVHPGSQQTVLVRQSLPVSGPPSDIAWAGSLVGAGWLPARKWSGQPVSAAGRAVAPPRMSGLRFRKYAQNDGAERRLGVTTGDVVPGVVGW